MRPRGRAPARMDADPYAARKRDRSARNTSKARNTSSTPLHSRREHVAYYGMPVVTGAVLVMF